MKQRILTLLLLATVYISKGQTWEKQYQMPVIPTYYIQVMDYEFDTLNGALIVGHNTSIYNPQSFIVRIDAAGDTLWTRFTDTSYLSTYYPDAVTTLSNGNYLLGAARHTSTTHNYDLNEIDLNGNSIAHTYIPIQMPWSVGASIEKGFSNDYFIKYQNDSMVSSSMWISRFFIERRQNNGTLVWRQMYADTSGSGTVHIFDIVPTPDGGVIFSYEENYITPGLIHLRKLDAAGNIVFDQDPLVMTGALATESYNVGPYIFPADDSTFIACYSISTYPGAHQRSHVLRLSNSTGAMIDSVSVYNKIRIDKGTATSNNKLVFNYFKYVNATSTVTEQGYITFDHDLNYNGMHTLPFTPGYILPKLVANNVGGAFLSYNNTSYHYYAANFDSSYVTYPSEISGSVSVDNNHNCLMDAGDVYTGNSLVRLTDAGGTVFYGSAAFGTYSFHVPYGNYTVTHDVQLNKFGECPAGNTYSFNITSDTSITANFYDTLVSGINDMEVMISQSCFVPGFNSNLDVYYFNAGTVTTSTTLKVVLDPSVTYLSSTPAPASISGDTLFYSVGPVYYDSIGMVSVSLNTPAGVPLGSVLTFFAGVPEAGDVTPGDNADTLQSIVSGAFDPNDKNVNQPYYIFGNEEMVYKVRFQNTGTLAAHNVIVKDTIDSDLDFSTFRLLSSSHPVNVVFEPGNGISFEFINIMLPDSNSNEPGSHGEIVYSIQPRTGRPVGTSINNKAFIYFDYNAAVITNTTTNVIAGATLGITKAESEGTISLFPNPAQDEISILVPAKYRDYRIELLDIAGRVVLEKEKGSAGTVQHMDVSALNNGIYLLKVSDKQNSEVRKLIISK